jgi:metallophosphoesterase (TIGR00282 family)
VLTLLVIGDVVGKPGRRAVQVLLPRLREQHRADFVVVNSENSAGGIGVSPETADEILAAGADCLTNGNHTFSKREILPYFTTECRILRPANYPSGAPGRGMGIFPAGNGRRIAVINLMGRTFMEPLESPFKAADALIAEARRQTPFIVIDFHAETTSEKQALGYYVDGKVSAVLGTHTHVQTADERVLNGGTAYLTDLGMTGPLNSVLGVRSDIVIQKFLTQLPVRFEVAEGPVLLCGAVIQVDDATGRAVSIRRIQEPFEG